MKKTCICLKFIFVINFEKIEEVLLSSLNLNFKDNRNYFISSSYIKNLFILSFCKNFFEEKGFNNGQNIYILVDSDKDYNNCFIDLASSYENLIKIDFEPNSKLSDNSLIEIKKISKILSKNQVILVKKSSLFSKVSSINEQDCFEIKRNEKLNINELLDFLKENGYFSSPFIQSECDFNIFGEVINIFVLFSKNPYRIYLDFDRVEKISLIDLESDKIIKEVDSIKINSNNVKEDEKLNFIDLIKKEDVLFFYNSENFFNDERLEDFLKKKYDNFYFWDFENSLKDINKIDSFNEINPFLSFDHFEKDLKKLLEENFRVYIYSSFLTQRERLKALLEIKNNKIDK